MINNIENKQIYIPPTIESEENFAEQGNLKLRFGTTMSDTLTCQGTPEGQSTTCEGA